MLFMNEWDIEEAKVRHRNHPVLSKATVLLYDLMNLANSVSDGWSHWPKPCKAAKKLQELIQNYEAAKRQIAWHGAMPPAVEPTEADLKKAVAPIKTFLTKNRKPDWPTLNLPC